MQAIEVNGMKVKGAYIVKYVEDWIAEVDGFRDTGQKEEFMDTMTKKKILKMYSSGTLRAKAVWFISDTGNLYELDAVVEDGRLELRVK